MRFCPKPSLPVAGVVSCMAVAVCVLVSVIGCGIARFDLARSAEAAETALVVNVFDTENVDRAMDSVPSVHKSLDAFAQHHRTLPHRTRSLTPSRWWHHPPSWPAEDHTRNVARFSATDATSAGRSLLHQLCVLQR